VGIWRHAACTKSSIVKRVNYYPIYTYPPPPRFTIQPWINLHYIATVLLMQLRKQLTAVDSRKLAKASSKLLFYSLCTSHKCLHGYCNTVMFQLLVLVIKTYLSLTWPSSCISYAISCFTVLSFWGKLQWKLMTSYKLIHTLLNCSILLHCVNLTLRSTFFCCVCATSVNILSSSSLYCHYMFRPTWPKSGVQVVVMKDPAALCNAVLPFLHNCLGLF
jgi:hypothetical protein